MSAESAESTDTTHSDAPRGRRSILFICTGNTCRSPLAEAICRRLLADELGCEPNELLHRGFEVKSAGVMAYPGDLASGPAVDVARELNADLEAHRSQPVNPELLDRATTIFAMTRSHLLSLTIRFPNVGPTPQLLCGDRDLPDPIGGALDDYRACAAIIREHLRKQLPEWLGS